MSEPRSYCEPDSAPPPDSDPYWDLDYDPESQPSARLPIASFFAWCPDTNRLETFLRLLSAWVRPSAKLEISDRRSGDSADVILRMEEAAPHLRREYREYGYVFVDFDFDVPPGVTLRMSASLRADHLLGADRGPLWVSCDLSPLPEQIPYMKRLGPSTLAIESALAWQIAMQHIHEILERIFMSMAGFTTGGCIDYYSWLSPIRMGSTYHADGNPARDLAMSWLREHRNKMVELGLVAGLPLDVLRERVQAAAYGESMWVMDGERLTREEVIEAISLPPEALVAALEVCAAKRHPEWEHLETELPRVIEELEKAEAEDVEMIAATDDHLAFIQECSPAYVERLDNGGILLFAHPCRTLWPLWSDALSLLGIRP
ncbi:hypothetical protein [Polyangium sorediatum]|uniref:Uncharacterized protein n=1 Tax=Polyangium sorediatum TaxID=889274 RepID=A0ABT6P755_9BACT|nr:hypothetical protein [Polyangium sorediatum]MDI1436453.1 hypothetical protein [Polyangium sorediatum]